MSFDSGTNGRHDTLEMPHENESTEAQPFLTIKGVLKELKYRVGHGETMEERSYFGVEIPKSTIAPYLEALRNKLPPQVFEMATKAKLNRDREDIYHITVLRPPEMEANPALKDLVLNGSFDKNFEIDLRGIGSVSDGANTAYYVIAESADIQNFRADADEALRIQAQEKGGSYKPLSKHNLHVTLGFLGGDVHSPDKHKDRSSEIIRMQ